MKCKEKKRNGMEYNANGLDHIQYSITKDSFI